MKSGKGYVGNSKDRKNKDRESADRDWVIRVLDRFVHVLSHGNMVTRGKGDVIVFSMNEDLTNKFGSVAILDATAEATPLYLSHGKNRDDLELLKMPEGIRSYANTTLHVCTDKNRRQSAHQLNTVAIEDKTIDAIVDNYLENLYPLTADGSKLLVCTFMAIEEIFRTRCKDKKITFIHWGEHDARNDFSHYTKVAAIGWFRKSRLKYYQDIDAILNDTGGYVPVFGTIQDDISRMITGGVAADFVQLFNRSRSRVCIDKEGNCKTADFYMFDDESADYPIDIIEAEMPNLKTEAWEPTIAYPIVKDLSLPEERAEEVVSWMQKQPGSTLDRKSIMIKYGWTEDQVRKLTAKSNKMFHKLLTDADVTMRTKKGRYGGTFFDIPQYLNEPLETEKESANKLQKAVKKILTKSKEF